MLGRGRRRRAHHFRVLAEELEGNRAWVLALVGVNYQQVAHRLLVAMVDREAGDHLADRQAGTEALGLEPDEPVTDSSQRRQHDAIGGFNAANRERLC